MRLKIIYFQWPIALYTDNFFLGGLKFIPPKFRGRTIPKIGLYTIIYVKLNRVMQFLFQMSFNIAMCPYLLFQSIYFVKSVILSNFCEINTSVCDSAVKNSIRSFHRTITLFTVSGVASIRFDCRHLPNVYCFKSVSRHPPGVFARQASRQAKRSTMLSASIITHNKEKEV